jgi:two-component system response regulator RstA
MDENIQLEKQLRFSDLLIEPALQTAYLKGEDLKLTSAEFGLLMLFAKNNGKVLSREYIIHHMPGISGHSHQRSVDVLVSKLRNKLKISEKEEYFIKTVYSIGYIFDTGKSHGF